MEIASSSDEIDSLEQSTEKIMTNSTLLDPVISRAASQVVTSDSSTYTAETISNSSSSSHHSPNLIVAVASMISALVIMAFVAFVIYMFRRHDKFPTKSGMFTFSPLNIFSNPSLSNFEELETEEAEERKVFDDRLFDASYSKSSTLAQKAIAWSTQKRHVQSIETQNEDIELSSTMHREGEGDEY